MVFWCKDLYWVGIEFDFVERNWGKWDKKCSLYKEFCGVMFSVVFRNLGRLDNDIIELYCVGEW